MFSLFQRRDAFLYAAGADGNTCRYEWNGDAAAEFCLKKSL